MNLARRINMLEDRLRIDESGEVPFELRLIAFRIMFSALHAHDRGRRTCPCCNRGLQHILDILNTDEAAFRLYIDREMETFAPYVFTEPNWTPIDGFSAQESVA